MLPGLKASQDCRCFEGELAVYLGCCVFALPMVRSCSLPNWDLTTPNVESRSLYEVVIVNYCASFSNGGTMHQVHRWGVR